MSVTYTQTPHACYYCPAAVILYNPLTAPAFIALFVVVCLCFSERPLWASLSAKYYLKNLAGG